MTRSVRTGAVLLLTFPTVVAILTSMLAVQALAATDQVEDAAEVMRAYQDAVNRGDANAAASYFTDTAILVRPPAAGACSRQSPCVGRAAILAQIRAGIADHTCFTHLDATVNGSVVTTRQEVRNDGIRANGIERIMTVAMAQVSDGRIAALYGLTDLTDPQTAAQVAITAGRQAAGAPIPTLPCS